MLVCVLCYGDHLQMIRRCISSIRHHTDHSGTVSQLRIGMNAVTQDVREYIVGEARGSKTPVLLFSEADNQNVGKYPLMRQMLRHGKPAARDVMWFDDDSFIKVEAPRNFMESISTYANDAELVGSIYSLRSTWNGNQRAVIARQPWYTGKPWPEGYRVRFATGGWWTARLRMLLDHDYPFPDMHHNGGDAILGELIYQQGYRLFQHNSYVGINADEHQRESRAPRRGLDTKPLWHDGTTSPRSLFNLLVESYADGAEQGAVLCESV